ncbi:MAG: hypothetical protein ABL999_09420 [Pyrinomonadaceae bacterium]
MKTKLLITFAAVVLCSCGGSTSNNAANSRNANSVSQTNKEKEPPKDMTPMTMDISEFMGTFDASKEGRMVTVTGGQLDAISYGTLTIRNRSGYAFSCSGSFGDYMSMAPKIDSLRQSHRSPDVVVEGKYSKSSYDNSTALSSCILVDLKK